MLNPYDAIKDSAHIRLCSGLAKGAVYTILFAWYEAGCPQLRPSTNYMQIAGLSSKNWFDNQERIMATLNEIMPKLQKIRTHNEKVMESNRKKTETMRNAKRRQRARQSAFADKETGSVEIQPINFSEKKWNEGRSNQIDVQRVKQTKKLPISADDGTTFTD